MIIGFFLSVAYIKLMFLIGCSLFKLKLTEGIEFKDKADSVFE